MGGVSTMQLGWEAKPVPKVPFSLRYPASSTSRFPSALLPYHADKNLRKTDHCLFLRELHVAIGYATFQLNTSRRKHSSYDSRTADNFEQVISRTLAKSNWPSWAKGEWHSTSIHTLGDV
ncbi:hypothetical protein DPEC_G00022340 [Dallia pectoralis]|uniref:Uncharacterized protein n=1 Tax=Dallia pectoralis TaxID=75939 RepID=A0ACC2HGD3_DALPE|nr:hypothetical protein DPEC_G00022340 [Dallia pectoralis]